MAEYSVIVIPEAAKPRLVERTAGTTASIERSVIYAAVAAKETAAQVQFVNRGYHASTSTYYYWTSFDHIDSSGAYWPYGSSPPFSEISDVIGITRIPAPE